MNKSSIISIVIFSLLIGFFYFDSLPKPKIGSKHGYFLKLFSNAEIGDLVILSQKTKSRDFEAFFRVVDTIPNKGIRIQYGKLSQKIKLNYFSYILQDIGNLWVKDLIRNDDNFESDTLTISSSEINIFKAKYYITTYGIDRPKGKTSRFPSNLVYVFFIMLCIIVTTRVNRYIKEEADIKNDIITIVAIFCSALFMASKQSDSILLSFHFNLYFVKNLFSFYALYYLLKNVKNKILGLDDIDY